MNSRNRVYLISITLVATLAGPLFGYDTAVCWTLKNPKRDWLRRIVYKPYNNYRNHIGS